MNKIAIITTLVFAGFFAKAQDYSWRLTYDVSIPLGDLSDYIGQESWRGMGIDNRWMITDRISVGGALSWHTFYEKKSNQYYTGDKGITAYGNQFRYLNMWSGQVNAHYYFGQSGRINPWIGLGVGTAYSEFRTDLGFYSLTDKAWSFGVTPQIGIDIPVNITTNFTLGVNYNYNTSGEINFDYSYIGISAGLKFSVF